MTTVLDHIVRHQNETLTLADVVRATELSRATAHGIVAELVDLGWLTRDADTGNISMGPALLTTARLAVGADRLLIAARPAIDALVAETNSAAFLARRLDDDTITVVEYAFPTGSPQPSEAQWMAPGRRIRLRPPICREFIASADQATREAWVMSAPERERERLRATLTVVADRGYSIERMTDGYRAVIDALATVPADLRTKFSELISELSAIDYLPDELTPDAEVGAVTIGAPILDAAGRAVGSLVSCPHQTMSGRELLEWGEATAAAARQVSAVI